MATLWRPGCCFRSDTQKRFSQAMSSRRCFSRIRDSSSRKVTSRVQWQPFSTPQCERTAWANALASASTGRLLM